MGLENRGQNSLSDPDQTDTRNGDSPMKLCPIFKTKDIEAAAVLLAAGKRFQGTERIGASPIAFMFDDHAECQEVLSRYESGELKIDDYRVDYGRRFLKDRVASQRRIRTKSRAENEQLVDF